MHSTQPPIRKGAAIIAIVWIAVVVCVLAWAANLAISHIMITLS